MGLMLVVLVVLVLVLVLPYQPSCLLAPWYSGLV